MSKRLVDLVHPNLYLFNLLFRHQVYLEGVKAGLQAHFRSVLVKLYDEFAKYVGQTRYDNMDAFTRIELQQFIRRFTLAQTHAYNSYTQELVNLLKQFVATDVDVTRAIYASVVQSDSSQHKAIAANVLAKEHTDHGNASLWSDITNEIIPANGQTLSQMLMNFGSTTTAKITNKLQAGYANNETVRETFASIVGNSDTRFRDGLFSTFANQNDSIIATALQHVSSVTQASIAGTLYAQYQWVAILDSHTSEICRSRNGNVYDYGKGPLPPAHYRCRSKAVSLTQGNELHDIPATYYDWLKTQPETVLIDMLGKAAASKIVEGNSTMKNISITDVVIPLTVSQFRSKISSILM